MDKTLDETRSAYEADGVPLNTIQEHLDKELLTSKQDVEMEYLKKLKRPCTHVGIPPKGTHGINKRQKK